MRCIRRILDSLEPVAIVRLAGLVISSFSDSIAILYQYVIPRQRWRSFLIFSYIGEDKPTQLFNRIPWVLDVGGCFDRFSRPVDHFSAPVVVPAVVGAANAMFFNNAVLKRRAPVRTMRAQQNQLPRKIAK